MLLGKSGLEMGHELSLHSEAQRVPIVLITGLPTIAEAGALAGVPNVRRVLHKLNCPKTLLECICRRPASGAVISSRVPPRKCVAFLLEGPCEVAIRYVRVLLQECKPMASPLTQGARNMLHLKELRCLRGWPVLWHAICSSSEGVSEPGRL